MKFANAPVSYGVFGDRTVDEVTTPRQLLTTMARAGYSGSELGPPTFYGSIETIVESFRDLEMAAVGSYVPLNTQQPGSVLDHDIANMATTLDEIEATGGHGLVILADEGDETARAHPRKDASLSLDGEEWRRLITTVTEAARRAEDRGLEVSFHPHVGTYVETPLEIERFLNDTDIPLTFDIGHIVLAGGDGVELYRQWHSRVNHVHMKDVLPGVLEAARDDPEADLEGWFPKACTRLGEGDARLDEFARDLISTGFDRWIVVEQDREPLTAETYEAVVADQDANLAWLHTHLGSAESR